MKWAFVIGALGVLGAVAFWAWPRDTPRLDPQARAALHATPLAPPDARLSVFYLGHSLIGQDIPVFVQQLAQAAGLENSFHSQLGWGASLRDHWEPDVAINGFEAMNQPPAHRDPKEALESGAYDAFVFTEMVDLRDAIRWHDSGRFAGRWASLARRGNANIRIYLYEIWHDFSVEGGWLERIDQDLDALWLPDLLDRAMAQDGVGVIHVIPAGTALAALVRAMESQGLATRDDLMARAEDGTRDTIHLGDWGGYFAALVIYATLYHRDPRGLPHQMLRADGSSADAPDAELAALMQQVAWDVVRAMPATGVAP